MSDITVLGRVPPSFVIKDIAVRVVLNETVTIPAEKAYQSKDLWLGISQGQLFQLKHGPSKPRVIPSEDQTKLKRVEEQNTELRQSLAEQSERVEALISAKQKQDSQLAEQTVMLQQIMGMLASGGAPAPVQGQAQFPPAEKPAQRPLSDAPLFIPAQIRDENVEARIEVKEDEGVGVADASTRLRELRKGKS